MTNVYTNFHGLNVSEDDIECQSFRAISVYSLLVYENKHYKQRYLDNCAYKIVDKQMIDYIMTILFKLMKIRSYKCGITIGVI